MATVGAGMSTTTMQLRVTFAREVRNWSARVRSENNMREHWGARASRRGKQRLLIGALWESECARIGRRPGVPALVRLLRISPQPLDALDNLAGSFKAICDEVAKRLGVDDRDERVKWSFCQQRGPIRKVSIVVEVTWRASGATWPAWDRAPPIVIERPQDLENCRRMTRPV